MSPVSTSSHNRRNSHERHEQSQGCKEHLISKLTILPTVCDEATTCKHTHSRGNDLYDESDGVGNLLLAAGKFFSNVSRVKGLAAFRASTFSKSGQIIAAVEALKTGQVERVSIEVVRLSSKRQNESSNVRPVKSDKYTQGRLGLAQQIIRIPKSSVRADTVVGSCGPGGGRRL